VRRVTISPAFRPPLPFRRLLPALALAAATALAGCNTSEERAANHYATALEHIEAGDTRRAILEFRNALQMMPEHLEARETLAGLLRAQGDLPRAVAHLRELVEYHPEHAEGHLQLAELFLELGQWDRVRPRAQEAETLLGEAPPRLRAVQVNLAYRDALFNGTEEERAAAIDEARALIADHPTMMNARRLVIDGHLRAEDYVSALTLIDAGIAVEPDRFELYQMRLGTLEELGRTDAITAQLEDMVDRFPEEEAVPRTLARWYVEQGDLDAAETFLRARAEAAPDDLERQTALASFLNDHRGYAAVTAELTRLVEAGGENATTFRAMRANLMFDEGEEDAAIADLVSLLDTLPAAEARGTLADEIRVDLARMRALTGDEPAARALITEVLDNDATQTSALKLRAAWQIEDDRVEDAIVNLRAALRESPRDPQIMTLLAAAHERAGDFDLQNEMLALAVEASRSAPEESLRYASKLISEERYAPAEDVLLDALRLNRDDVAIITALGRLYVAVADWPRAQLALDALDRIARTGDPEDREPAARAFATIQAQALSGQQRDDELFAFLDRLADTDIGLAADVAIIRAHAVRGETGLARERLAIALQKEPDSLLLQYLDASIKAVDGEYDAAEAAFEALLEREPAAEQIWIALYRLHFVQGDDAAARAVLDRALEALPDGMNLLFARAGELERDGDIDGAIAIYEALYARNSSVTVVANNLASLLAMYRQDEASLDRAWRIARRLRGSDVPAFRDTYGWIAARRGDFDEAVDHLSLAADAYPDTAVVQYHYAVALAGLDRHAEALERFELARTLGLDTLPAHARTVVEDEIARLTTLLAEAEAPAGQ
jgi:predicted Zn-dependent protease